ncbi:MAG: hypothetical protein LW832_07480 [Parachlamydia sp.]|nr:hypothetical protein [Parachlamydia sp.]
MQLELVREAQADYQAEARLELAKEVQAVHLAKEVHPEPVKEVQARQQA